MPCILPVPAKSKLPLRIVKTPAVFIDILSATSSLTKKSSVSVELSNFIAALWLVPPCVSPKTIPACVSAVLNTKRSTESPVITTLLLNVFVPVNVCVAAKVATVESIFNVTAPEVPPPVKPVPAVTPVMSPCGIVGNVVKLPAPFIYCALVPPTAISTDGFTAASLPILTANALPPCVAATEVTVPVLEVKFELLLNILKGIEDIVLLRSAFPSNVINLSVPTKVPEAANSLKSKANVIVLSAD